MPEARVGTALEWGIRVGFRDYLDALPDAEIALDGVERTPDGFRFAGANDPAHRGFTGRLRMRAHAGALDLTLADPAVVAGPDGTVLVADMGTRRAALARLLDVDDVELLLAEGGAALDVALTIDGSTWLGGVYGPWARMDPVRIRRLRRHDSADPAG